MSFGQRNLDREKPEIDFPEGACTLDQVGDDQLGGGVALGEIDFGLFAVELTLAERHGGLL